jgi:hypothetical protein
MAVFVVVVLCSMVEVYGLSEVLATSVVTLIMEAAGISKTLVKFN